MRRKEIASLTPKNICEQEQVIILDSTWTKNRKAGRQPLSKSLLEKLLVHCVDKRPDEILFPINDHIVRYFDIDLKEAGIEKHTPEGKLDFHALRATFGTLLIENGENPKVVQELMRHSTVEMTMKLYVKSRRVNLENAVTKLDTFLPEKTVCAIDVQPVVGNVRRIPHNPNEFITIRRIDLNNYYRFESRPAYHFSTPWKNDHGAVPRHAERSRTIHIIPPRKNDRGVAEGEAGHTTISSLREKCSS